MSIPSKKRRAEHRCCFIDDEALEDHDKDSKEDSEEEKEEDNQESDEEDLNKNKNNNNSDFEFNVDVSSKQHFPPLFESSSESVNDKCDDDSQQTHDQQVFPLLYESSDDADDESLNTNTATSSAIHQEETAVPESKRMFDCPIITSFPRPSFSKDRMPEFKYNEENAPCHRDAVITYETMGDDEILLRKEPLESNGIKEVHSFVKQGRGLLWHNRTLIAQ